MTLFKSRYHYHSDNGLLHIFELRNKRRWQSMIMRDKLWIAAPEYRLAKTGNEGSVIQSAYPEMLILYFNMII